MTAQGNIGHFKASEDLSEYLMVSPDPAADNGLVLADGADSTKDEPIGITETDKSSGEPVTLSHNAGDIMRAISGSALTKGDRVKPGTGADVGKAVVAGTAEYSVGRVVKEDVDAKDKRVFIIWEPMFTPA